MKRSRLIAAAAVTAALAAGTAGAAYAVTAQSSVRLPNACVRYGEPDSILGNYMLWNWNNSTTCPGGTYAVYFPQSVVTETVGTQTTTVTVTPPPTSPTTPPTTPGEVVTLTTPAAQVGVVGAPLTTPGLQIHATDNEGLALTYYATNLPAGLTINAASGLITGTPTTANVYTVSITVADTVTGVSSSTTFQWTITT